MKKRTINRYLKTALPLLSLAFWLGLWWILATIVDNSYFLPSPSDTLKALFGLFGSMRFYRVVLASLLRVLLGLSLGIIGGVILAALCHSLPILKSFISPVVTLIKAMPVAAFIIILWISMRGSALTVFIGFMMVMPIIYQNTLESFSSLDKGLLECAFVFELSRLRKLRLLVFPTFLSYFTPALITSIGLAFKSQIAAEIIAYTKGSIGQYISDAKYNLNTPEVFAWALVIVAFSILLESLTKFLLRRTGRYAKGQ